MSKRFLVFQHTAWEGPGHFLLEAAHGLNAELIVIKLWAERVPDLAGFDGLIVLGGQPNIDQAEQYPFLQQEKRTISQSLQEDRPYLGICLGHQLLAAATGAAVGNNYCSSLGFINGFLTKKGRPHPFFKNIPNRLPLFKWHSQAILEPIPRNITILATSAECQVEAFSLKGRPHIVGVQFANNAAATQDVKRYLSQDKKWLSSLRDKEIDASAMLSEARQLQELLAQQYTTLFSNFMALS